MAEIDNYSYEEEQERITLSKILHQPIKLWYNSLGSSFVKVSIKLVLNSFSDEFLISRINTGTFRSFGKISLRGPTRKLFKSSIFILLMEIFQTRILTKNS